MEFLSAAELQTELDNDPDLKRLFEDRLSRLNAIMKEPQTMKIPLSAPPQIELIYYPATLHCPAIGSKSQPLMRGLVPADLNGRFDLSKLLHPKLRRLAKA